MNMDMVPMKSAYVVDFNLAMTIFRIRNAVLAFGEDRGVKMVTHGFRKELLRRLIGIQLNK